VKVKPEGIEWGKRVLYSEGFEKFAPLIGQNKYENPSWYHGSQWQYYRHGNLDCPVSADIDFQKQGYRVQKHKLDNPPSVKTRKYPRN
jgi:hypothetical protein